MILVRSAAFNIWFYGITVLFAIASLGVRIAVPDRALWYARLWVRVALAGLRPLCGITWVVTGLEHVPDGPALIASQHQSAFDALVWVLLAPRFAYVLKRELTRVPLFGPMLRLAGMIVVDRSAGATAIRDLLRGADRAMAQRRQIVIFPEGTRVPAGVVGKLQPGVAALAARTGLPVIPVATDSGICWGRRAFRKLPGVIRIAVQPPLPAGLPREALMTELAIALRHGAAGLAAHVDNSVDEAAGGLRSRCI